MDEDENAIIFENERFSQRLLSEIKSYTVFYEKFLNLGQFYSWYTHFTSAKKDIRGFFAYRRFMYPNRIRLFYHVPMLDGSILLSSKLFRLYYYRSNKKSILVPIGVLIYSYLIDNCSCLSVDDMVFRECTSSIIQLKPMKIDDDGGIPLIKSHDLSIAHPLTLFFFNKTPLWDNLLPGRYDLTCQMQLRRQLFDQSSINSNLLNAAPIDISLLGDRADRGGQSKLLRYNFLIEKHQMYGDDQWFNITLIENFLLNDISNIYFGIRVQNGYLTFFNIWIKSIQLNLISIN
ncbi:unnamed protein product [Adineta ricciae]|uniref:Uncharacterized protein n=1 Tax=Adineta ricciae TaxID=249248 RepID=A0A815TM46_ADIRI|nr:unnamed protein product [Adineta ricciae]CAF1507018.1 unnamed protein product [Adineta ricciae]